MCVLSTLGLACGAEAPAGPPSESSAGADPTAGSTNVSGHLRALDHDVALGSTGPDAAAVNGYLTNFGYFPNATIAREHPAWRPLVSEAPSSPSAYDARTVEAVRKFQANYDLPVTGVVDKATRELMNTPRCGWPDGLDEADPSNKYSIKDKYWGDTVKWYHDDWYSVSATMEMLNKWAAVTNLTFVQTSDNPDITLHWGNLDDLSVFARTNGVHPPFDYVSSITFNTQYTWYMGSGAPVGEQKDYKTVALHELGHALGLGHSSHGPENSVCGSDNTWCPVMRGPYQGVKRDLRRDDRVGVSAMYDQWQVVDTDTSDVGIGSGGDLWVVAASTHNVWKLDGSGWHNVGGDASRIAVGGNGWPYVIAGWGDGSIWFYNSATPGAGTWQQMPGGGCARDIGAAPEGIGTNAVWVIGCGGGADTAVFKYNPSCGCWNEASGGGYASGISVDAGGYPWIVTSDGRVFRHSTNYTSSGVWEILTSNPQARDIGAGPAPVWSSGLNTGGHYPWITAFNQSIYVLNKQPSKESDQANLPPPELNEWHQLAGAAIRVAVDPDANPWVVDAQNRLYKTQK
jgi:peptidoglycan hydrolase-like protein with peptidoglycan-binding domain